MKKQPLESIVFVIDDDASMRASLKSLFESVGFRVQLYGSADAFLQSERPDVPCCLVLDVRLPGLSGLEFQSELAKIGTDLPILLIGDIPMTVKAMKAGAVEFLTKPCRDQDLLDSVRLALNRDHWSFRQFGRDREKREGARYVASLTERPDAASCLVCLR
jgi:FixJ family two-component response regulator